jgi:hypothetical protein
VAASSSAEAPRTRVWGVGEEFTVKLSRLKVVVEHIDPCRQPTTAQGRGHFLFETSIEYGLGTFKSTTNMCHPDKSDGPMVVRFDDDVADVLPFRHRKNSYCWHLPMRGHLPVRQIRHDRRL